MGRRWFTTILAVPTPKQIILNSRPKVTVSTIQEDSLMVMELCLIITVQFFSKIMAVIKVNMVNNLIRQLDHVIRSRRSGVQE